MIALLVTISVSSLLVILYNRSYRPFNTLKERLKMNNKLLLHLGIDGPKVNLSFETKLKGEFYKRNSIRTVFAARDMLSSPSTHRIQKWFTKTRFSL